MKFFKNIWTTIKIFFLKKKKKSDIEVYNSAIATIEKGIDKEDILTKASNATNDEERKEILKPLVEFESAKQIIQVIEQEPEILSEQKPTKRRKKLYDLHELENEIKLLQGSIAFLDLKKSSIKEVANPDTSSFDSRIDTLFSILSKNKIDDKVELSDISISAFDKDFKQLEKLLNDRTTLQRHKIREKEKKKLRDIYESNIIKELNRLETFLDQNKLEEAKTLINQLSKSVKPDYKKGVERLSKATARLKKKELEIFEKRHAELLKRQAEEAERLRIANEKLEEERRRAREQVEAIRKAEEEKKAEKERKLNELLEFKFNWRDFEKVLKENGITGFYHFTDTRNLKSIIENKGLYSWYYCDMNNIDIPVSGGSMGSRENDKTNGKKDFVRVAFKKDHPMLFVAKNDGRILQEEWLNIDIKVAYFKNTEFSDKNAAAFSSYKPIIGKEVSNLENVHFDILKKRYFDLEEDEKKYYQAEVLVKTWIPIDYITNIKEFA